MKKILLYMFALVALVTAGCSGTSLITSWAPDKPESVTKYKKVMIIGLLGDRFIELRQKTEAIVAKDLTNMGINAISAYETFGPKEFQQLKEKEVVTKMKELEVDAVMFIALLDRIKEKDWVPGYAMYTPYGGYYHGCYWCHYNIMYGRVYSPGYFSTTTTYLLEFDLYSVADNKLQYSAHVKSIDPSSAESLANNFSNVVVKDMRKNGMLPDEKKK